MTVSPIILADADDCKDFIVKAQLLLSYDEERLRRTVILLCDVRKWHYPFELLKWNKEKLVAYIMFNNQTYLKDV